MLESVLQLIEPEIIKTNKRIEYFNMPVSFDIETTSFYDNDEKVSIMYVWMVNLNGFDFIGRTWDEFISFCDTLSNHYQLHQKRRLLIYVHNLSYEFQFICKRFNWLKVFAVDIRKPVYALSDIGIEFRCSYLLSGYSLERLGDNLINHKVSKLVGLLDYSKIRHKNTVLTDEELAYCLNDVRVVTAYIQERIENDGDITKLPLTKTGYVRQYCKSACFGKGKNRDYMFRKFIQELTLRPDEYIQLKRAFQGGFAHANPFYAGKVIDNVSSFDFTSSYPSVMIAEKFPMMKGESVTIDSTEQFFLYLKSHCCMFDCIFEGLESKFFFDSYISYSRTWGTINATVNNGRIVRADKVCVTLTEQDFMIVQNMYTWDSLKVGNFNYYLKSYLPTKFVNAILKMYGDKTKLKGVNGREYDYARSKEMLNSAYGMIVTDICRDEITYDNKWESVQPELDKMIFKYNTSKSRFLFYPWGVWVTAYARRNLFTGIIECAEDYVYSDTDSIKIVNKDKHLDYIERYNDMVTDKLIAATMFHGIDFDNVAPLTIDGKSKQLGVWDFEGTYDKFKTLGAKRYLTKTDDVYQLTVSGLSKNIVIDYMLSLNVDPFEFFNDDMYIPKGKTGKMVHTYIDDERRGLITDYNGVVSDYSELSSIHLEECDYSLKISHEYADYILGLRDWSL